MNSDGLKIMVVVKDNELAQRIKQLCPNEGVRVHRESSIDRLLDRFESELYEVLLITNAAFKGGQIDAIEVLEVIAAKSPMTQVLFLVEPQDIQVAMSALKVGTYQYAKLPVSDKELRLLIEAAIERSAQYEKSSLLRPARRKREFENLIGKSPPMQEVYRLIRRAAATDIPVLLVGETGTGKELVAQAIHRRSDRRRGPYIPVNLGALPRELVASELFGHEKGAFTGAFERRIGRFEEAREGTIFLDEISSVEEKVQVSLLRLIEQRTFRRLAGRRIISTNARLIVATNEDLAAAVQQGRLREDLYYRLDVFRIALPPIWQREGDIRLLAEEFLKNYSRRFRSKVLRISPEAMALLEHYKWPGNVRELKNVVQRAVLVCQGDLIRPDNLPPRFQMERPVRPKVTFDVGTPLSAMEREMIIHTLTWVDNNRKRAAELLGISRRSFYDKLRKYAIK